MSIRLRCRTRVECPPPPSALPVWAQVEIRVHGSLNWTSRLFTINRLVHLLSFYLPSPKLLAATEAFFCAEFIAQRRKEEESWRYIFMPHKASTCWPAQAMLAQSSSRLARQAQLSNYTRLPLAGSASLPLCVPLRPLLTVAKNSFGSAVRPAVMAHTLAAGSLAHRN